MRIVPLGVRGSTAAPGAEFIRYGGHTSCVAVIGDAHDVPRIVLDAGTGLRSLPQLLAGRPFRGHIILTHLHWDHTQGLPFSSAVDHPRSDVHLHVPVASQEPQELLGRSFSPPFFPISPDGLLGRWEFLALAVGELAQVQSIDEAVVTVAPVAHKGGPTLGIRVELDGASLAYLPDHAWHSGTPESLRSSAVALARGADLLLHDGQYLDSEGDEARSYGHSTVRAVAEFADLCEVARVAITHHAPDRTDDALDEAARANRCTPRGRPLSFVRQGEPLDVIPRRVPA